MKVKINWSEEFAGMAMWIYDKTPEGLTVVKPMNLILERYIEYGQFPEPTLRFDSTHGHEFLQSLVNALVEAGVQPDQIKATNKEISVIKEHLYDMRRLYFKSRGMSI